MKLMMAVVVICLLAASLSIGRKWPIVVILSRQPSVCLFVGVCPVVGKLADRIWMQFGMVPV